MKLDDTDEQPCDSRQKKLFIVKQYPILQYHRWYLHRAKEVPNLFPSDAESHDHHTVINGVVKLEINVLSLLS